MRLRIKLTSQLVAMGKIPRFDYTHGQRCSLETLVLVSRRLEDMKNGLGLGLGLDVKVSTFSRP